MFSIFLLTACAKVNPVPTSINTPSQTSTPSPTITPSQTVSPTITTTPTATPTPTSTLVSMNNFMQGVSFPAYHAEIYSNLYTEWTLKNIIKPMGANWVSVHFMCAQKNYRSTKLYCDHGAPSKADISNVVRVAHNLGFRVFLEIGVDLEDDPDHWAGDIGKAFDDQQWQEWFESYTNLITDYAVIAEQLDVDMFSIGSELRMTISHEEEWREVASAVKKVYSGPILYSSVSEDNWLNISWWDAVDYIGIHPYNIALSNNHTPTVEEMIINLEPVLERLEKVSNEYNRQVILTELGIYSINGISGGLGVLFEPQQTFDIDLQEQADCYTAIIEAYQKRDWWKGVFWFAIPLERIYATNNNIDVSPFGKPAENVVREFYGVATRPTPTAISTPTQADRMYRDIYIDEANPDWYLYPPGEDSSRVNYNQNAIAISGNAIEIILYPYNGLNFGIRKQLDLANYDWFEFDIYATTDGESHYEYDYVFDPMRIIMEIKNDQYQNATPLSVEITNSPYLEGGHMEVNEWQHVLVPLDLFGPFLTPVEEIVLRNFSSMNTHLFIDNVRLLSNR